MVLNLFLVKETYQVSLVVKNIPADAGYTRYAGLIPGSGRSPRVGHGNPLQYSCLENSKDRGAWQATVHWVAKSQMQLSTANSSTSIHKANANNHKRGNGQ